MNGEVIDILRVSELRVLRGHASNTAILSVYWSLLSNTTMADKEMTFCTICYLRNAMVYPQSRPSMTNGLAVDI